MEPTKRVMVDLETLGCGPLAVIVAIGAVKMTDKILDTCYLVEHALRIFARIQTAEN